MMHIRTSALVALVAVTVARSGYSLEPAGAVADLAQICKSLLDAHAVVQLPAKGKVKQSVQKETLAFPTPHGMSPVVLLRLPEYLRPYTLTVTSQFFQTGTISRTHKIFVPSALVLDETFQQTRFIPENRFKNEQGTNLWNTIYFGPGQAREQFVLLYTRADLIGAHGKANVSMLGDGTASGAVGAVAGSVFASALQRTERSAEGRLELEVKPEKLK